MQTELPNMPKQREQVLAVPSAYFSMFKHCHLISGCQLTYILNWMSTRHEFLDREAAEQNEEWRQIIPYVLVTNQAGEHLVATRSKKQGENRLWGKHTLGVGGHINPQDEIWKPPLLPTISRAAIREYKEETGWDDFDAANIQGLIITNETPVDRVHIGVLYHQVTRNTELNSPEAGHHNHRWVREDKLGELYEGSELWSRVVIGEYLQGAL
jgi:predicted NUDIX family phosphoesterase